MVGTPEAVRITAESLCGINILAGLNPADRAHVAACCQGQRFPADAVIVTHRDSSARVFFMISGTVRITYYSKSGKEVNFREMGPGQMFGELSAIDGKPRSADVVAASDCVLCSLSHRDFVELLRSYPDLALATMTHLAALVRLLTERVVEFSTMAVRSRVHAELLRLARQNQCGDGGAIIDPAPTHAELANRVSTHREAVTRELQVLVKSGVLRRARRALHVNDLERLQRLVEAGGAD